MKNREAWLLERRNYVGASDVGALLLDHNGQPIHPYKTPHDVWLDKKGLSKPQDNVRTEAGLMLEAHIADRFRLMNPGIKLRAGKTCYGSKPYHASNPDKFIVGRVSQVPGTWTIQPDPSGVKAILQLKSAGFFSAKDFGVDGSDHIPDYYQAQVQWEMYTAKADLCVLALLYDTHLYHQYLIYRDDALIETLKAYVDRFWNAYVLPDIEPPVTGHKRDTEWLNQAWEPKNDGYVKATEKEDAWAAELSTLLPELESLEARVSQLKNNLRSALGENAVLATSVGNVTWKADKNGQRRLVLSGIKAAKEQVA